MRTRYFGVKDGVICGAVFCPDDEDARFSVDLIEKAENDEWVVLSGVIASEYAGGSEAVPPGTGFQIELPTHWRDGSTRRVYLRVKETGKVFPDGDKYYKEKSGGGISPSVAANAAISDFRKSSPQSHLVVVTHEMSLTGAPIIALNLIRYFRETRGHFVTCVSMGFGGAMIEDFREAADILIQPASNSDSSLKELNRVLNKFLKESCELAPTLLIANSLCSLKLLPAFRVPEIPVYWLIHEFPHMFSRRDINAVFDRANRIIFPSELVRRAYIGPNPELLRENSEDSLLSEADVTGKSIIAPQGVCSKQLTAEPFAKPTELRKALRDQWGVAEDAFVVLCVGTVDDRKGADWFVRFAIEFLSLPREREVNFIWVGKAGNNQFCRHLELDIFRSSMAERIRFVGESTDMESVYLSADLFLLSSRLDPFPNVVLEALLHEVPVIGFDQGHGTSEILPGCGTVIPYMNLKACELALTTYMQDEELRLRHGRKGREIILDRYHHECHGDAVFSLMAEDLGSDHPAIQSGK